jgi:hypothetical protein
VLLYLEHGVPVRFGLVATSAALVQGKQAVTVGMDKPTLDQKAAATGEQIALLLAAAIRLHEL